MPALLLSLFSAILYLVMTPEESDLFVQEVLYHNRDTQSSYSLPIRAQILRIHIFQYLFVVQVVVVVVKGTFG